MSLITITKGPGIFSRQKTDENGNRLPDIENIEYNEKTFHVNYEESVWLIDKHLFSIKENEDGTSSVFQGQNIIVSGKIIKTNF